MSSSGNSSRDEFGVLQVAEALARSSNKRDWHEALFQLQDANVDSPYVAAILGLAFAKIRGNEDYRGVSLDWVGYQQDRVSVQQLVPS